MEVHERCFISSLRITQWRYCKYHLLRHPKTQDKRASADANITCEQLGDLSSNIKGTM